MEKQKGGKQGRRETNVKVRIKIRWEETKNKETKETTKIIKRCTE